MINSNKIFATIVAVMLAIIAVYYVDISDGLVENFTPNNTTSHIVGHSNHPMSTERLVSVHPSDKFKSASIPAITRISSMGLSAAVPDSNEEYLAENYSPQNCTEENYESHDKNDTSLMRAVMGSNNKIVLGIKRGRLSGLADPIRGDLVPCKLDTPVGWFRSSHGAESLQAGAVGMLTDVSLNSTSSHVQMAQARAGHNIHQNAVSSLFDDVSMTH